MNTTGLRKAIKEWVKVEGRYHVCARLIDGHVAPSTADQLTRGCYPQEPTGKTKQSITNVLIAHGKILKDEAS